MLLNSFTGVRMKRDRLVLTSVQLPKDTQVTAVVNHRSAKSVLTLVQPVHKMISQVTSIFA